MKKMITTLLFVFILLNVFSQAKLGDVACVYLTTPDLDSSTAVYEKLGFPKIASNTFPVPWSQSSDGSLLIMMRKDNTPYIGLTYYTNNIEKVVADLEKEGIVFTSKPKDSDPIKRYYFKSPDGFNIMLASNLGGFTQPSGMTMLTMKPADFQSAEKYPNKKSGVFGEYCHPVTDLKKSIEFWTKLGFTLKAEMDSPYPHAIMSDGLMIIGLHQTKNFNYPAITYFGLNTAQRIGEMKQKGLTGFTEFMGMGNQVLTTFEKQHFFMFSIGM